MRSIGVALGFVGLLIAGALAWQFGRGSLALFGAMSLWMTPLIMASHLVPLAFDTLAWMALVFTRPAPRFVDALRLCWICESVNRLLPVAQIGGEVVRVRLARGVGVGLVDASGAAAADILVAVATQVVFSLIALAILLADGEQVSELAKLGAVLAAAAAGVGVMALAVRYGALSRFAASIGRQRWKGAARIATAATALVDSCAARLARPSSLLVSSCWRLASWLTGALEVWIACHALGQPISLGDAVVCESLIQLARSAAFFVPSAIGVQEAAFVAMAGIVGGEPTLYLSLALIRRGRELAFGMPGIAAWFGSERRAGTARARRVGIYT